MTARIYRLLETHQRIDQALREEQRRRRPDTARTSQLKKLKLWVKDILYRVTRTSARV